MPHPLAKYLKPTLFLLLLILCIAPLVYLNVKLYRGNIALQEDRLNDRKLAKAALVKAEEALINTEISLANSKLPDEKKQAVLAQFTDPINRATKKLQSLARVKQESHLPAAIARKESEQTKNKQLIPYFAASAALPFLIAIPAFFSASSLVTGKPASWLLGTAHSIPGLHLLVYSVISALWNLEGFQRKNNLLLTLPFSAASLFCLGLGIHLFQEKIHYAVTALIVTYLLWGVLHCRQIQMIQYAKQHKFQT